MNALDGLGVFATGLVVGVTVTLAGANVLGYMNEGPEPDRVVASRIRYPGEEEHARRLCAPNKVAYWWVQDPRRNHATMHAECAGRVSKSSDIRF